MAIPGLAFDIRRPTAPPAATRADVALFVGLIARRPRPLPGDVAAALDAAGWRPGGPYPVDADRRQTLLGVPVAVESWAEFDRLFDWRGRESVAGAADALPAALGLAVRRFFGDGGARAWIVRCGDPLPLTDPALNETQFAARQLTALAGPVATTADAQPILPGLLGRSPPADPLDAGTWRGAAVAFALDDVAMLLLPDLPDLCGGPAEIAVAPPEPPGPPEAFHPCAPAIGDPMPPARGVRPDYRAVRLDRDGYRRWALALRHALELLGLPRGPMHRRDVMLVAGLPMPAVGDDIDDGAARWPLGLLTTAGFAGSDSAPLAPLDAAAIGNARLQLAYPWLRTAEAAAAPEGLQSPDAALAALIARAALENGSFRSAAGRRLTLAATPFPVLAGSDVARGRDGHAAWLGDRLCLFAERRGTVTLLSDVTAADSPGWRKGGTSRLMATLLRVCRHIGDDLLFEPAGPALWSALAARVAAVLEQFRALGAFDGNTAEQCYQVICDRRSMTQSDIDAGRIRCDVIVNPASPIERILVTLALLEPLPAAIAAPPEREAA